MTNVYRLVSAGLLALLLASCGHRDHNAAPSPSPSDEAPASGAASATPVPFHVAGAGSGNTPAILTYAKNGRRAYVVRSLAFTADTETENGLATLDQPHITFYDRTGSPTIADAPHAVIHEADHTIVMTGGVHTQTADGATMTCDTLRYDGSAELLHGSGSVVMRTPNGLTLRGSRVDGDVRLARVRVSR